jgi:molecular chaperone Hsp33
MIPTDYMIKAMDKSNGIKVVLASTTRLAEYAHQRHHTSATASAALGRVLTAALIMTHDLKDPADVVSVRFNGDGPAGMIIATATGLGTVRGYISEPQADLPATPQGKLNVGGLVGTEGYVEVLKDIGLKQPFTGRVPLVSGEIAEDLVQYYMHSEQVPTLLALGVLVDVDLTVKTAGGLMVQALPGADQDLVARIEQQVLQLGNISSALQEAESLEELLRKIMGEIENHIIGKQELNFCCTCSRERLAVILSSYSKEEIERLCDEEGIMEVTCNFCNEQYHYTPEQIMAAKKPQP